MKRVIRELLAQADERLLSSGAKGRLFESVRAHHTLLQTPLDSTSAIRSSDGERLPIEAPGVNSTGKARATHRVLIIKGGHVLLSIADYEAMSKIHWTAKTDKWGNCYATAHTPGSGKRGKQIKMHRVLMGAQPGQVVDHVDGWGLNNSRENLRLCTNAENCRNQKPRKGGLKGITPGRNGQWRAQIMVNFKKKNLGEFPTPEDAARAYDAAARSLHGEFARLNFPNEQNREAR